MPIQSRLVEFANQKIFWLNVKRSMQDDMPLELYYYNECEFSQSVLNIINNLKIGDQITMKNIRENPQYEKELIALCGDRQVPTLKIDGQAMRESEVINRFLLDRFLD